MKIKSILNCCYASIEHHCRQFEPIDFLPTFTAHKLLDNPGKAASKGPTLSSPSLVLIGSHGVPSYSRGLFSIVLRGIGRLKMICNRISVKKS